MAEVSQRLHLDPVNQEVPTNFSNSQASSLGESSIGQSPHQPASSLRDFNDSQLQAGLEATTPSTSLSVYSSQESAQAPHDNLRRMDPLTHEHHDYVDPEISEGRSSGNQTPFLKRTANGEIKPPTNSLPTSPMDLTLQGHSRTDSTTSKGSQIGELSHQLRTRLSYAMVKVQNGWEHHSISELEHMSSSRGSPISATSLQDPARASAFSNASPRTRPLSAHSADVALAQTPKSAHGYPRPRKESNPYSRLPLSATAAPTHTYESFWQSHSSPNSALPPAHPTTNPHPPSLAPPADILPRTTRPPSMPVQGSQAHSSTIPPNLTQQSFTGPMPSTPPPAATTQNKPKRAPLAKMRTPSQQAAVEKDAVETLLFMSSPGNSQHFPASTHPISSLQPPGITPSSTSTTTFPVSGNVSSPTHRPQAHTATARPQARNRAGLTTIATQTAFPASTPGGDVSHMRRTNPLPPATMLADGTIDTILDEMPDSDNSSSEGSLV